MKAYIFSLLAPEKKKRVFQEAPMSDDAENGIKQEPQEGEGMNENGHHKHQLDVGINQDEEDDDG